MSILTINSGSTSVKLAWYEGVSRPSGSTQVEAAADPPAALRGLTLQGPPAVVAHRVVHGGTRFSAPVSVDAGVLEEISRLGELAPLHNGRALHWMEAATQLWPRAVQVAVFDTAFFHGLPRVAAEYALSPQLGSSLGVRRYGFHGLAHQAMWEAWCAAWPGLSQGGRIITLQLGGGCSMAAIDQGRPLDTTMGFSPLEGLVMATRSGDIDPAVVPYLQHRLHLSAEEVVERLNTDGGLAGLTGRSSAGDLLAVASPEAGFALDLYCYRIRKYLGAYLGVLGGCDGILFGGGVGEHVPQIRERVIDAFAWAGIFLDGRRNAAARGGPARVDAGHSRARIHVVSVDEQAVLARAAAGFLPGH